jgi:hypothetical protein
MKFNLTYVYDWCGGFGETITIVALVSAIVLAACGHLNEAFAAAITAIGASGIAHDQMTQYQDRKDREQKDQCAK